MKPLRGELTQRDELTGCHRQAFAAAWAAQQSCLFPPFDYVISILHFFFIERRSEAVASSVPSCYSSEDPVIFA